MTKQQLTELKEQLLATKQEILNKGHLANKEDLCVQSEDLPDEADLANSVINQQISFQMRERELGKLRAIEHALDKMERGSYGLCEECDGPIEFKRLKGQPFAVLCITHAEELERERQRFIKGQAS